MFKLRNQELVLNFECYLLQILTSKTYMSVPCGTRITLRGLTKRIPLQVPHLESFALQDHQEGPEAHELCVHREGGSSISYGSIFHELGLAPWLNRLIFYLETLTPYVGASSNLGCSTLIQFPTSVFGKAVKDGLRAYVPVPTWEIRKKLLVLDFTSA